MRATALDRRRQAQIRNQSESITRLLTSLNDGKPVASVLELEREIMSKGLADAEASRDEALEAAAAVIKRAREVAGDAVNYDHAARTFAEDVLELLSAPVSESGASVG